MVSIGSLPEQDRCEKRMPNSTQPGISLQEPNEPMIRRNILLVEDDSATAAAIRDYLKEHGFKCRVANSGAAALNLMKKATFDAIITDVRLPDIDGVQLIRRLASITSNLTVLFLTAWKPAGLDELPRDVRYDVLQKPAKPAQILEKLLAVLKR